MSFTQCLRFQDKYYTYQTCITNKLIKTKITRVSKSPLMVGMELLSPIDEYYIQLSYYSLIAIFQKTGFMHIQACREQYLFNNSIFLPI